MFQFKVLALFLFLFLVPFAFPSDPESQPAGEASKQSFVESFQTLDTTALRIAAEGIRTAGDEEAPAFMLELARLYRNAVMIHGEDMNQEANEAITILDDFMPEGIFETSEQAGYARIEHARLLMDLGKPDMARAAYRDLADHPNNRIFVSTLDDVMQRTVMTDEDIDFWSGAIERRLAKVTKLRARLEGKLNQLRRWNEPVTDADALRRKALAAKKRIEILLYSKQRKAGMEQIEAVQSTLQNYFALAPEERGSRKQDQALKLLLAQCEVWTGNYQGAVQLLNSLLGEIGAPSEGEKKPLYAPAKYWQIIAEEKATGLEVAAKRQRLISLLSEPSCGYHLACEIVEQLASIAEKQGDSSTAHSLFKALADHPIYPAQALWARTSEQRIVSVHPELKDAPISMSAQTLLEKLEEKTLAKSLLQATSLQESGPQRFALWRNPGFEGYFEFKD